MYQIKLKGYKEMVLCLHDDTLPTMPAFSVNDCSLKCDVDADCAAFVFENDLCTKRLPANTADGDGMRERCYVKNYRISTVTGD